MFLWNICMFLNISQTYVPLQKECYEINCEFIINMQVILKRIKICIPVNFRHVTLRNHVLTWRMLFFFICLRVIIWLLSIFHWNFWDTKKNLYFSIGLAIKITLKETKLCIYAKWITRKNFLKWIKEMTAKSLIGGTRELWWHVYYLRILL